VAARSGGLVFALLLAGCSRDAGPMVTTQEGPAAPLAELAGMPPVQVSPAAPLPGSGPFYDPDPAGKPVVLRRFDAPSILYAGLEPAACLAEIARRGIAVEAAPETAEVATPLWLRGLLHGVAVHSALPEKQRRRSEAEIFDCRLILAVDDFAALLAARDVVEVVHLSAHRPRASNGCLPRYPGLQHCAALALDVGSFRRKDGSVLKVERDFHGRIGQSTCAGRARPKPASAEASELWSIVCDAAARALFHVILTPNYNAEHRNHFHVEIAPGAAWMLVH
jgi:hypothetical protein